MPESSESLVVKGPKGIVTFLLVLVAGGGIGASAIGLSNGRDATVQPTPWLSRAEAEGVAAKAANDSAAAAEARVLEKAAAHNAAANAATLAACTANLNAALAAVNQKLGRIDQIAEDVAALRALSRVKVR
jgi:hypothetical protein